MKSKKIRIAFIAPRYGSILRGVESFVHELVSHLDINLFDITIISGCHSEVIHGIDFHKYNLPLRENQSWINKTPYFVLKFFRLFNLSGSTDIESLSLYYQANRSYPKKSFDIAIPLGGYWTYALSKRIALKVLSIGQAGPERRCLDLSDFFVALTPFDENRAHQICPKVPTAIIPNGVNLNRFKLARSTHGLSKVILCVAALVEDKRHDLLFDAVLLLPETVRVVCIGDGPLKNKLSTHPLVISGRVDFRLVPFSSINLEYETADVFSLASLDEAFGIVFIEAMAAGLPIVAHDGPRQRFVVGEVGLLCDVTDTIAYSLKLFEALKIAPNPAVRQHAVNRFSWEKISSEYSKLFLTIASPNA